MVFTSSDSKQETKQLVTNFEHPLKKKYPKRHHHYAFLGISFLFKQKQVVSLIGMNLVIFSPAKTSF